MKYSSYNRVFSYAKHLYCRQKTTLTPFARPSVTICSFFGDIYPQHLHNFWALLWHIFSSQNCFLSFAHSAFWYFVKIPAPTSAGPQKAWASLINFSFSCPCRSRSITRRGNLRNMHIFQKKKIKIGNSQNLVFVFQIIYTSVYWSYF